MSTQTDGNGKPIRVGGHVYIAADPWTYGTVVEIKEPSESLRLSPREQACIMVRWNSGMQSESRGLHCACHLVAGQ